MAWLRWFAAICVVSICLGGCDGYHAKKPDPTKGVVTGIVLCADTGKPARFAWVTLTSAPDKDGKFDREEPLPVSERVLTDLNGRFRMEAVEPGNYMAFATLDGYLDPKYGIDYARLEESANDQERILEAQREWKDQLVPVSVSVHRASEIAIQIMRAAELDGSIAYDDGSPAIGIQFRLFRKTGETRWTGVGTKLFSGPAVPAVSNSHGRYQITNLPAGVYIVCASLPTYSDDVGPSICLGNVFRRRDAVTVTVQAGETARAPDITFPLMGIHTVAGTITAVSDGHPVTQGAVRLLYADDRENAQETTPDLDGNFSFSYVPAGEYILQISGAADPEQSSSYQDQTESGSAASGTRNPRHYADKEIPLIVRSDVKGLDLALADAPPAQAGK